MNAFLLRALFAVALVAVENSSIYADSKSEKAEEFALGRVVVSGNLLKTTGSINKNVTLWKVSEFYLKELTPEFKKLNGQNVTVSGTLTHEICYSCGDNIHLHVIPVIDKVITVNNLVPTNK